QVIDQFNRQLPDGQKLQIQPASVPGDTQADRILRLRMAVDQAAQYLDDGDRTFLFPNGRERETVSLIGSVVRDSNEYFQMLASGPSWLRDSLAYLQKKAFDVGKRDQALVDFTIRIASELSRDLRDIARIDGTAAAKGNEALIEFMRGDFAKPLANANSEFTNRYTLA